MAQQTGDIPVSSGTRARMALDKPRDTFVCLFVYLFILGRKLNRQNCLHKEVLREREEKKRKKRRKVISR